MNLSLLLQSLHCQVVTKICLSKSALLPTFLHPSCTCMTLAHIRCGLHRVVLSSATHTSPPHSWLSPSWLVEAAPVPVAVSGPTHGLPGRPPCLLAPSELPWLAGSDAYSSSLRIVSFMSCQCPCICWFCHTAGLRTYRWCARHLLVCHLVQRTTSAVRL